MTRAAVCLARVVARVCHTPEALSVDQWADRFRVVPAGTSERPGRWSTAAAPYLREIMACFSDPAYEAVTFRKASQVGGTEVGINCLMWLMDVAPGPTLIVYPNKELAASVNTDRIKPALEQTPRIHALLRKGRQDQTTLKIRSDRMTAFLGGSNSAANLSSRPIQNLIVDEMDQDEFAPKGVALAAQRLKAYRRKRRLNLSTPSYTGVGIDAEYLSGDRRRYEVPCPHCKRFQELRWKQVRWRGPGGINDPKADKDLVEATAWLVCEHCSGSLENPHKADMLAAGKWVKEGQWIDEAGAVVGEARHAGKHASFRINSLYSPWMTFGYVAKVWIKNGGVETREWTNGELGEPWVPAGDKIEARECEHLCVPVERGGYKMLAPVREGVSVGKLPGWVLCLVGGIDLQHDRAYVEIRGFGEHARKSGLIFSTVVKCEINDANSLRRLDAYINARWLHADGLTLPVAAWGIDSGDGGRTMEVYQWAMSHPNVFATKGRSGGQWAAPFDLKMAEVDEHARDRGVRPSRGHGGKLVRLLTINTHVYKERVMACLRRPVAAEAAGTLKAAEANESRAKAGGHTMLFPAIDQAGVVKGYLQQLTSEQLSRVLRNDGSTRFGWVLKPGRTDNHHLDTCVIAMAVADSQRASDSLTVGNFAAARMQMKSELAAGRAAGAGGAGGGGSGGDEDEDGRGGGGSGGGGSGGRGKSSFVDSDGWGGVG